ncbi:uncharacterized protein N7500_002072 [Penicillium coprophilum]|uniref:uncharacterized protein n=1 Tax=Penicillium coprophilum TaxID=36646 RepID=UPI00239D98DA|nr:uncharacterized protein N7500_002072 [Penicillium coprophilum]KAJ5169289.1 hypothetical protein N7500_002072 [Penicillium coprophilum]
MANQVSLLAYLQQGPPSFEFIDVGQSKTNTTNANYGPGDIRNIDDWEDFNITTILQEFGPLLNMIHMEYDPIRHMTPERGITSESGLHLAFGEYFHARIRRSLRHTFEHLEDRARQRVAPHNRNPSRPEDIAFNQVLDRVLDHGLPERTTVLMGVGSDALTPDQFTLDLSLYAAGEAGSQRRSLGPNRLPGDMKPSWKWSHSMKDNLLQKMEFRKALAQVNWYMKQHSTQFGFILTEQELVPIRRLNDNGDLRLANPIP